MLNQLKDYAEQNYPPKNNGRTTYSLKKQQHPYFYGTVRELEEFHGVKRIK